MEIQTCTKCGIRKPLDAFGFDRGKRRGDCKGCHSKREKVRYQEKREEILVQRKEHYLKNREDILTYKKEYGQENSEKISRKNRAYREENRERLLVADRQYYAENREVLVAQKQEYRRLYPEKEQAARKKYYGANKELFFELVRKRRARLASVDVGDVPSNAKSLLYAAQDGRCLYCQEPVPASETGHLEHRVPISRGGSHTMENLAFSCAGCNLRKGMMTDEEFLGRN